VLAANVDIAFVVAGMDGDFNLRRLERYLAVAWSGGSTPVIVLNKADSPPTLEGLRVAAEAIAPGVEVRPCPRSPATGVDGAAQAHLAPGRTAVVLGSSGVGKSTLVNALVGQRAAAHGRGPRGRLARPPHDHPPRARPPARRRAAHRHPGHPVARRRRRVGRARARVRRHRRPRAPVPVQRLPPRGEPGCAVTAALADGHARRRPARQPPQARA
jgi:hypothetical protein